LHFSGGTVMSVGLVRGLLIASVAAGSLAACSPAGPPKVKAFLECLSELHSIGEAVSTSVGYPNEFVDVFGNQSHLQIAIFDPKLVAADAPTREKAATAVAAAAERALASHAGCASVNSISVAIYHPSGFGGPPSEWHSEDVVEFRRGPDQRFAVHVQ
jgi:hypothetical protein